ncbi:hypothetical protein FSP39_017797 [Pinctada imbricata]|uniref:24-hydroxycholesterol 7-alpha-hydroxylase n=1 Tax=Pinctada imbricata TaxID=66713 RepID=A0AA88Y532_PINIB|nr:hypothetical protein FSP39_017797 [Pinctada imbricata]
MVKGRLASSRLDNFTPKLQNGFEKQFLKSIGDYGSGDLVDIVRNSMYAAVMDNLFGENVLPTINQKEFMVTAKHFILFDEQFEYGARLPPLFLSKWSAAKRHLLGIFSGVIRGLNQEMKEPQTETLLETLVGLVDKQHAPNYGLLLLWASLANAIPITFWTLSFIHSDQGVLNKLRSDIDNAVQTVQKDGNICYDEEFFRKVPYLKWCILEAIRLKSVGIITRRVVKAFQVKGQTIPEGDMLMLSPFWAHRNPKYFENPNHYNPDRWRNADLEKNLFLDGFVAFGGGRYQCPGRYDLGINILITFKIV